METRIVISLSSKEAILVERIALDKDKDEVLRVIEEVFMKKIREASGPH